MDFWLSLREKLGSGIPVCLLYVVHSSGSSPGRQGFRQFVSADGTMEGSIGGGPMEQKLVELARHHLQQGETTCFIRQQVHQSNIERNRSGMICSGEQTIAFCFLDTQHTSIIEAISNNSGSMIIDANGLNFDTGTHATQYTPGEDGSWNYIENLSQKDVLYIIGGGHVCLALSKTMNELGFKVIVYDDRESLNTIQQNHWAETHTGTDYSDLVKLLPQDENAYVAIMTTGYRTDKIVLRQLAGKNYCYLGMLGSREKVSRLFTELIAEGIDESVLGKVRAPIGIAINSRTPQEIAVSIAAEIISIKNAAPTFEQR